VLKIVLFWCFCICSK